MRNRESGTQFECPFLFFLGLPHQVAGAASDEAVTPRASLARGFVLRCVARGFALAARSDLGNRRAWMVRHAPVPGLAAAFELLGLNIGSGDDEVAANDPHGVRSHRLLLSIGST